MYAQIVIMVLYVLMLIDCKAGFNICLPNISLTAVGPAAGLVDLVKSTSTVDLRLLCCT